LKGNYNEGFGTEKHTAKWGTTAYVPTNVKNFVAVEKTDAPKKAEMKPPRKGSSGPAPLPVAQEESPEEVERKRAAEEERQRVVEERKRAAEVRRAEEEEKEKAEAAAKAAADAERRAEIDRQRAERKAAQEKAAAEKAADNKADDKPEDVSKGVSKKFTAVAELCVVCGKRVYFR
jgi:membrane protein involved in colicin uptake